MDMMGIEPTMVSTPPLQHPHHAFHSPHSAFSMPSNNIGQRGGQRSHSVTPNSMMRHPLPHQNLMRQSPVPFHHNMQTINHHSPHPQTTPIPEIHPSSYPPQEHHFNMSPTLSCPIRESPHHMINNTPVNITQQELLPPHTLCYTQPPIYNQFKPQQVHTPPQTSKLPSSYTSNSQTIHLTDSSIPTGYPQQVSTPLTYTPAVTLPHQYSSLNTTDSTSSQPSLESVEYDADIDTGRAIDESTANLIISTRDELSDLTVSPAPLPFSVVVTSIATSSHDNMSDSSNFPTSPTCLSSPHSSKFPLNKERKAMDKKMRREIANCNERKRMENINSGFRCLKVLLPQSQNEKTSKAAILQQTSKYIHKLVEEKRRLIEENDKFKHELSKYMVSSSQYGGVMGKNPGFIQPNSGFQPFNVTTQISKPDDYYRMQDEVAKLQDQLKHERNSKCMLEKINRELESRVGFMESVHSYNADPLLSSREAHCKNNVDAIVMSLEQLEGECFTNPNRPPSQPSVYEGQTPYIEIMDRSTTPYIDRNTPVGHFRAIKSPMPHH